VVYVVVTTVVFVAGAKENCPMVAYGSTASACAEGNRPSAPGPEAAEAMLCGCTSRRSRAVSVFLEPSQLPVGGTRAACCSVTAERARPPDVMS
jgi:hypothetical protein